MPLFERSGASFAAPGAPGRLCATGGGSGYAAPSAWPPALRSSFWYQPQSNSFCRHPSRPDAVGRSLGRPWRPGAAPRHRGGFRLPRTPGGPMLAADRPPRKSGYRPKDIGCIKRKRAATWGRPHAFSGVDVNNVPKSSAVPFRTYLRTTSAGFGSVKNMLAIEQLYSSDGVYGSLSNAVNCAGPRIAFTMRNYYNIIILWVTVSSNVNVIRSASSNSLAHPMREISCGGRGAALLSTSASRLSGGGRVSTHLGGCVGLCGGVPIRHRTQQPPSLWACRDSPILLYRAAVRVRAA